MTATRTLAQRAASRNNGAKSRGPTSLDGKARSRGNALKHGLSDCDGVVVPSDLQGRADDEVAAFFEHFKPRTAYEATLVRQAAMASVRLTKLGEVELAASQENVRRAADDWDAQQQDQVAALAELFATDPGRARRGLWRTTAGCEYLADAWADLATVLEDAGTLDAACRKRLANLSGYRELTAQSHEAPVRVLVELCDAIDARDPAARTQLLEFLRSQEADCRDRAESVWRRLDGPSRTEAPRRAMLDASPDGRRLMRYLAAAERSMRRAIAALEEALTAEEPAPAEDLDAPLEGWQTLLDAMRDAASTPPAASDLNEPDAPQDEVPDSKPTRRPAPAPLSDAFEKFDDLDKTQQPPKHANPETAPPLEV